MSEASAATATTATTTATTSSVSPQLVPTQTRRNNNGNDKRQPRRQNNRQPNKNSTKNGPSTLAADAPPFVPSQGQNQSQNQNSDSTPKKKNNRNRNRKNQNRNIDNNNNNNNNNNDDAEAQAQASSATASNKKERQNQQQGGKANNPDNNNNNNNNNNKIKNRKRNNKRNKNKKQPTEAPWKKHIPEGSVDPITLDELDMLRYPPFALVANEPYVPVPVWPVPEQQDETQQQQKKPSALSKLPPLQDIEEINRQRLAEQWGKPFAAVTDKDNSDTKKSSSTSAPLLSQDDKQRHFNLFDGRALAYYMVSQLQFIDPLTRRDLTRDELLNLDTYLRRHGFTDLNVTEAYDAKGVTLSFAGSAAATAAGRAEILQQQGRVLLNSLFGGRNSVAPTTTTTNAASRSNNNDNNRQRNSLQQQYAAIQQQEQSRALEIQRQQESVRNQQLIYGDSNNTGIYASDGLVVIDDDQNPGLRGRNLDFPPVGSTRQQQQQQQNFVAGANYGSIAQQHGTGLISQSTNFPALSATAVPSQSSQRQQKQKQQQKSLPPSSTLSRISGAVKKTDPEEAHRQWEAREEARKKALYANLSFGVDPNVVLAQQASMMGMTSSAAATATAAPAAVPAHEITSAEKLERNRAFAEALGVKPATMRNKNIRSGWARPVDTRNNNSNNSPELDEYGNELGMAQYPESLILEARERLTFVVKLEKKWKTFLADDTAASLPLSHMDRPTRKFVHEYSDFWKLQTESFDPEPKRYIHCVKLLDTSCPYPLLSEAAKNWQRGSSTTYYPTTIASTTNTSNVAKSDHSLQQTAGQTTRGRETLASSSEQRGYGSGAFIHVATQQQQQQQQQQQLLLSSNPLSTSRFDGLFELRERPKLELAKRTLPLELPPFDASGAGMDSGFDAAKESQLVQARQQERQQEQKLKELKKQRALEDAFASDDENDSDENNKKYLNDDDSDWGDVPEPLYNGEEDDAF